MEKLPMWLNEGTKPTADYIKNGWRPEYKAPASYFNWMMNKTYLALEELQEHQGSFVSEEGRHDMRYWNGYVSAKIDGQWVRINKLPPITNIETESLNNAATLRWKNPVDETFTRVVLRYKVGSYPTSITDGYLAYEGNGETITVENLSNELDYYFRAFTVSTKNVMNDSMQTQTAIVQPARGSIFGVKIDMKNSNPATAVTYIDGATDSVPAQTINTFNGYVNGERTYIKSFDYGSWRNRFPFNQIKPCLFRNGTVYAYLDPYDFTKYANGTSAGYGDVMIEFPKIYWKIEKVGTDLFVRYSWLKLDSTYKCLAHMRGEEERDFIYISAYMGTTVEGKTRSLTNYTPTDKKEAFACRELAQANGPGYEMMTYHQMLMLQVLFLVMFKSRDSQASLGDGFYSAASSVNSPQKTGLLDKKGMFWGDTMTSMDRVKFCGIEDPWGNSNYFLEGIAIRDTDGKIFTANTNFKNTYFPTKDFTGYTETLYSLPPRKNSIGFISDVIGTTELGFIASQVTGSETTYFPDMSNYSLYEATSASFTATAGGTGGKSAGIFNCTFGDVYGNNIGSRISYY
ncbi:hypothetical protein ACPA0F_07870 [Solibacillus silvestris]